MLTVMLSLKPKWWNLIKSGHKRMEIRKSEPKLAQDNPFRVIAYITGGIGVCGEFICTHVQKLNSVPPREKVQGTSCLTPQEFIEYSQKRPLYGWNIESVQIYEKPISIQKYGLNRPPQSWQYIKDNPEV